MTVYEILAAMDALQEHEWDQISAKLGKLRIESLNRWMKENEAQRSDHLGSACALSVGVFDDLPDDLAHNHDHYLYGTPKRHE